MLQNEVERIMGPDSRLETRHNVHGDELLTGRQPLLSSEQESIVSHNRGG